MVLYQGKFSQPYIQYPVRARTYVLSHLSLFGNVIIYTIAPLSSTVCGNKLLQRSRNKGTIERELFTKMTTCPIRRACFTSGVRFPSSAFQLLPSVKTLPSQPFQTRGNGLLPMCFQSYELCFSRSPSQLCLISIRPSWRLACEIFFLSSLT